MLIRLQGGSMGLISRRDAAKLLIAGSAGLWAVSRKGWSAERINSVIRGVQIGSQSYSFRDRDLDACLEAFKTVGLGECELSDSHVAPKLQGEELRKWWLSAPPSHFREVRTKFDDAGVKLYAFAYAFRKGITDEEMEAAFRAAQTMGVKYITSSSNVSVAPRVDKCAQKYKIMVGFHGH